MADENQTQSHEPSCNRRRFLPLLFQEIMVTLDSAKGKPGHQLSELGSLPDEQLGAIIPVVNRQHQIFIHDGHVCSRYESKGGEKTFTLFPMKQENLAVFNRINGRYTLGEIGDAVAEELDWDEARAFAHARDLFLSLVSHLVCVPQNAPD